MTTQRTIIDILRKGNINDPTRKYQIQAWPGEYTGLHLISIMYAAFQQFAPDTDIGIDLSKEHRIALGE